MADNDGQKKKDEKTDPSVIKIPKHIGTAGYIDNFVNTAGYIGTLDLASGASILDIGATARGNYLGGGIFAGSTVDITGHGPVYTGTQPLTFATQAEIIGATSIIGKNLAEMKINTIGDARNFMVGVNNVASIFSENSGLLKSIESASIVTARSGKLTLDAIAGINIQSATKGIELATAYHLDGRQMVRLSESVTTVLAYGKAVQTQFDGAIASNVTLRNGMTALGDMAVTLGKTVQNYNSPYIHSGEITSPFFFEPQKIKTKEVEKVLPEVKKELPVKITEAIEIMEHIQNPDTKNDDKVISNTIGDLKRAMKTMLGFSAMFMQQTTQKVEILTMPPMQVSIEKSTSTTNKFPFKIPAGTTWQNIVIQFTDSNYVNIQVAGHSHPTGYADMGFVDKRTSKPTIQWGLLSILAKGGGELPNSSSDASDNYKKHKQLLSEKLKGYFNIESDPFEPYKGGYKTRMTLVPPPVKKGEPKNDYSITDEVDDMFRDLTEE